MTNYISSAITKLKTILGEARGSKTTKRATDNTNSRNRVGRTQARITRTKDNGFSPKVKTHSADKRTVKRKNTVNKGTVKNK